MRRTSPHRSGREHRTVTLLLRPGILTFVLPSIAVLDPLILWIPLSGHSSHCNQCSGLCRHRQSKRSPGGANTVQASTIAAGTGYTSRASQRTPHSGRPGGLCYWSYNAAALNTVQLWIMQSVPSALPAGGGGTPPHCLSESGIRAGRYVLTITVPFWHHQGTILSPLMD